MKIVTVRNLIMGTGRPKICVPIVAKTEADILEQANSFTGLSFDLVEWRADWFDGLGEEGSIARILGKLHDILGEKPVLFTIRTRKEGGEIEPAAEDYMRWNETAAAGGADLIDVDLFSGREIVRTLVKYAHERGAAVIGSSHDFRKTPENTDMEARLADMDALGCDIAKLAVMPQSKEDVLRLLTVTEKMSRTLESPLITMSMGGDGVLSRLCGEVFGSCLTFGAAKKASAPGQIGVDDLEQVLEILHKSM